MLRPRFLLFALVATAAATLAAKPASADTSVKVPFSFTADGKRCPAGTYQVKVDPSSNSVTLVGRKSSNIFSWVVMPRTGEGNPQKVVLQFDREGSDHALRSIQYGRQATPRLDTHERQTDELEDAVGGR